MHPIAAIIENPVKVSVGVILVLLFGLIAMFIMPIQLSPDVERPSVTVSTTWPGASPQEIEKEIVQEQEEQLKSVEGITKMSSECLDSEGSITMEFNVGTDLQEAVLKINSQLQRVRQYPLDADKPVIRTSNSSSSAIAWFILSALPPDSQQIDAYALEHPEHAAAIDHIQKSHSLGLKILRLREFVTQYPAAESLLPPDLDVPSYRKFAEDFIEAEFERVPGVANSDVRGGQQKQLQVIVDPEKLAARGLTMLDVRDALNSDNQDTSAGDFNEGKRRMVVRVLGEYRTQEEVENQIVSNAGITSVYLRDVAKVQLDYEKPSGVVRRFGVSNISINCQRETGANVIDVMAGLKSAMQRLNEGRLQREGLVLTQVYDETEYIDSAINLVNQNIILGSALTIIVMMLFLHMCGKTLVFVPLLAASSIAAIVFSPWFFVLTLFLILLAGFWFARGALVVAIAIPTSIIGTFLILNYLGRSLNVISLAGLAFAVGMLVDNAVVVLENVYRYHQLGKHPFEAARLAAIEVWGAVLASTLTTLFVFLPIVFLEGEAGQLFVDIALGISAAVGLSLIVSIIVIPTAAARILQDHSHSKMDIHTRQAQEVADRGSIERFFGRLGSGVTNAICNINAWIQRSTLRRIGVVALLMLGSLGVSYLLLPQIDYLPEGNRNLVISFVSPPPGYNVNRLGEIGEAVEQELRPYWDFNPEDLKDKPLDFPPIGDFFYVARDRSVFLGIRAYDPTQVKGLIELIQAKLKDKFPGTFVTAFQTSLFGRGLSGGRSIDVEIVGPELEELVKIGGRIMGQVKSKFPENTQARPQPSLDLSSPELHVVRKPQQGIDLGINNTELGFAVNTLIDGAYVADYFIGGEKIDLVLKGSENYSGRTQDLESQYIATRNVTYPVRLDAVADVQLSAGPEQINRRERQRAISIEVSPPPEISLEDAINRLQKDIIAPMEMDGTLGAEYQINLSGTADKLKQTWDALSLNILLAVLITYLLMAALFESWLYPVVIILSVPLGAVGGIIGLKLLGYYLVWQGGTPQSLDVLTMLGFVILIGTVVNNAILLVHQSLNLMRVESMPVDEAILSSIRTRIRPIFMTTLTTVFGLSPLVFFPGAGSELYRGLGSVVLGGLVMSTVFTLVLIPALFSLTIDLKRWAAGIITPTTEGADEADFSLSPPGSLATLALGNSAAVEPNTDDDEALQASAPEDATTSV